jgi:hypothetical protein
VKRSAISSGNQRFFGIFQASVVQEYFRFSSSDTIVIAVIQETKGFTTTQVFRDPSAWYHIVVVLDTPQATASDRLKLYVNGTQVTTFSSTDYPSQNATGDINNTYPHFISNGGGGEYFNGYMTNIHFINGQALTPSSFTETDATTGQLIPKTYSGSYGTNGFNLLFADNSSNTAATLGKDTSPNGNNFTPNNLSVTAGAGNDSLVDSPTNYGTDTGVGGSVRGNYATLNPVSIISTTTLSNGNLESIDAGSDAISLSTIGVSSGKWYWEITGLDITGTTSNQRSVIGIVKNPQLFALSTYVGSNANGFGYYSGNGQKLTSGTGSSYGATWATGNVMGVALDLDNGTLVFYKNNTSQGTAFTGLTTGDTYFPAASQAGSGKVAFNFGQRAFAYTAPSGFKALCTQNLPAPLVAKSNTVFDIALYTGNGGTQTISGLNFSPDFTWIKCRSNTRISRLVDTVRGATKILFSSLTNAEETDANSLTAFNSNGFSIGSSVDINESSQTFVSWNWDAGTSTVSNTAGSITSQVRANATAGFSVVTYTGNAVSGATVGHGLGVAPNLIIIKCRSNTHDWIVYHASIGNTGAVRLNTTAATQTLSVWFNNSGPSSTTFTLGNTAGTNESGSTFVAYAFAPVVGYSSFGSYTGNGSADGPFVYTGFRPRWVMIKGSSFAGESWFIWDTARNTYNQMGARLLANEALAENSDQVFGDILSNGFKLRNTWGGINGSGNTYIYAAFAEMPFNYSRAR